MGEHFKSNPGWFRKGLDPRRSKKGGRGAFKKGKDKRRHKLTDEERRKGGINNWLRNGFYATDPLANLFGGTQ